MFATVKRTFTEFSEDNMSDWAAALTYYGLLSLFPALIALVSIVGLFGDPATTTKAITDMVTKLGPSSAADTFAGPIKSITSTAAPPGSCSSSAWATALWSASAYVGAFMRAANIVLRDPRGPAVLEAASAADPRDARDAHPAGARGRWRSCSPAPS